MNRITKAVFVDSLCSGESILSGAYYRQELGPLIDMMDGVERIPGGVRTRTVRERRPTKLVFSNGSAVLLDSTPECRRAYYEHVNPHGVRFLLQSLTTDIDAPGSSTYVVYIV